MTIIEGSRHEGDVDEWADVVVVGSGSGGAVVAKELAEAGLEVVVLEEGPHIPSEVYGRYRPMETLRHIGRESGGTPVLGLGDTPIITVMSGRAVGGSSILTGGVCFRIPSYVHHRWVHERHLRDLTEEAMEACFEAAEKESRVETVPEAMRSRSTTKFVDGATKLGIPVKPIRRNTDGCVGYARCNFGCPVGAKWSVDRTYLPKALSRGARIYADALVDKLIIEGGRVVGVSGHTLESSHVAKGRRRAKLRVRAPIVVLAAGTIHTPLILMKSGLRGASVGRHLTLHPGFRVVARFDDPIEGWKGALQSAYVDQFEKDGVTMTGLFVPPSVLAGGLPGVGPAFAERIGALGHLAIFGGIVHDEDGGRIHRFPGREPLITYRLAKGDKVAMMKGIRALAMIYLEAGAKEIYAPIFGMPPIRDKSDVERITAQISAKSMECVTFHPLGTARMAKESKDGVVNSYGEAFELPGLFVADGSVFPTSIGVNSQLPIMAMATRIAWHIRDRMAGGRRRSA